MSIKDRASVSESLKGGGGANIEDCFSTYVYTGTGASLDIVNGIDLATDGGMVWIKERTDTGWHSIYDTERGDGILWTNSTSGESAGVANYDLETFNSNGFSLEVDGNSMQNTINEDYVSWTFKKQPRFFDMVKYTGNGVAGREIAHELGCDVGMMVIKSTTNTNNWIAWHRNDGVTSKQGFLNTTNSFQDASTAGTFTSDPTNLVFTTTLDSDVNGLGREYIAYLFAHDPLGESGDGSDGMIACGSYVGDGSVDGPEIDLGWEPQYVMAKNSSVSSNWYVVDMIRGIVTGAVDSALIPNSNVVEYLGLDGLSLTPTGFKITTTNGNWNGSGYTYIYMAIRRPMKTPLSSDEVFGIDEGDSTDAGIKTNTLADFCLLGQRAAADKFYVTSRLTGGKYVKSTSTAAEGTNSNIVWDRMDGAWKRDLTSYIGYNLTRATGFFDVVAYTGDGSASRTVNHNLGVVPEMIWTKVRNTTRDWYCHHSFGTTDYGNVKLSQGLTGNTFNYADNYYMGAVPDDSAFYVSGEPNYNSQTFIAYLFATLAGISKVGSYTGNGTSQTIDCGFSTGTKFLIIKRTDSTGDWFMWDTTRGIVAGNDPHLSLNTTAAEVTTDDSIDPDTSGFIVNQVAATNINVTSAEYIYYSVALPI